MRVTLDTLTDLYPGAPEKYLDQMRKSWRDSGRDFEIQKNFTVDSGGEFPTLGTFTIAKFKAEINVPEYTSNDNFTAVPLDLAEVPEGLTGKCVRIDSKNPGFEPQAVCVFGWEAEQLVVTLDVSSSDKEAVAPIVTDWATAFIQSVT